VTMRSLAFPLPVAGSGVSGLPLERRRERRPSASNQTAQSQDRAQVSRSGLARECFRRVERSAVSAARVMAERDLVTSNDRSRRTGHNTSGRQGGLDPPEERDLPV